MRTIIIIINISGLVSLNSCSSSILNEVFDNKQVKTINEIVDFYDDFVLSQTDNKLKINEAYLTFLDKNGILSLKDGELSLLIPPTKSRSAFFNSLDKESLSEIYFSDSICVYDKSKRVFIKSYRPNYFSFNPNGKFVKLLKKLSERTELFKNYYEGVQVCGDICPTIYSALLSEYKEIDFSRKEERLAFIAPFLFYNESMNRSKNNAP